MNTDRIEKKILLHAPPGRVWRALADSKEFGTWFGVAFQEPFTPGARMHGVLVTNTVDADLAKATEKYEGLAFDITIEKMEPGRLFSFRWHPNATDPHADYSGEPSTLVEFFLEEKGDGVLLTLTESGFDQIPLARRAQAFSSNDQGWAEMVQVLDKYLTDAP